MSFRSLAFSGLILSLLSSGTSSFLVRSGISTSVCFVTKRSSLARTLVASPPTLRQLTTKLRAEGEEGEADSEGDVGEESTEETDDGVEQITSSQEEGGADILNSPAFLKRKVEVLKSDLEKIEEEIDAAKDSLEEGKADWGKQLDDLDTEYATFQSRLQKQSKGGSAEATIEVVRKMLEVLDNYDRAFGAINAESDEEKAIEADYFGTKDMILSTFESLGVKKVETLGTEFDYEVHQAVMSRPSDEYDEGIVMEELAPGFQFGDKLIRAAMVTVAA